MSYSSVYKALKQPVFSSQNGLDILLVLPSDLVVTELQPQRWRQESLSKSVLLSVCLRVCVHVCVSVTRTRA